MLLADRRRLTPTLILILISILLAACGGGASTAVPTATPQPTQPRPTTTPTALPPPTVTPFPTGDAGDDGSGLPDDQPTGEGDDQPTAEATGDSSEATPLPTTAPDQPTQPAASDGFPPGIRVGSQIFSADFYQGWPTTNEDTARVRIIGGRYVFEIGPFSAFFMTTATVDQRDTYTQVEASPDRCPAGNSAGYGLIFRYVDNSNYYLVTFFCDNTFSVVARLNGSLIAGDFADGPLPDAVDSAALAPHLIGVQSKAGTHTIYFDGIEVAQFEASQHEQGDVGMYASSNSDAVIVVGFDNLGVWNLR